MIPEQCGDQGGADASWDLLYLAVERAGHALAWEHGAIPCGWWFFGVESKANVETPSIVAVIFFLKNRK